MKRKACMIISLLVAIITAFNISYIVKDEFFYSLDDLPKGELLRRIDEVRQDIRLKYGVNLYVYEVHATAHHPEAIRVEVENGNSGTVRTVYWQIGTSASFIGGPATQEAEGDENALNETVITINGVPIDFLTESYDCRDYYNFTYVPEKDSQNGL